MAGSERTPEIYVISLARRGDRYQQIQKHLSELGLAHSLVEAVDGALMTPGPDIGRFVSPSDEAIVRSHKRAWSLASAKRDGFSLVLEDDARLRQDLDWRAALPELEKQCQELELDVLQFGYLTYGWKGRLLYAAHEAADVIPERRLWPSTVRLSFCGRAVTARRGVFRGGSHAYLLSARAARELERLHAPFAFPVDVLLGHLAHPMTKRRTMNFASLKDASFASQMGRTFGQTADSDNLLP